MKRTVHRLMSAVLVLLTLAAPASAAVNVSRSSQENPMVEIFRSTIYGGLAGLVVGGALALASDSNDNDGDIVRYSFVAGTFVGLAAGIYFVSSRPQPSSMLEIRDGKAHFAVVPPTPGPRGGVEVRAVAIHF